MQLTERLSPATDSSRLDEVRHLISESLWGDSVIRIEYASPDPASPTAWEQWGAGLFAFHDAQPVINEIKRCHSRYPTQPIRLSAETLQPRTRLLYYVYQGQPQQPLAEQPMPVRSRPGAQAVHARRSPRAWGYAALAGALLGSVLVVEMAIY
jgi:ribulose bisphosphate carboxylase small subunit